MTLLPRRSPLAPRPLGLNVASTSYESPVAVYRQILRLAKRLAVRWDDDHIFHAQRFLAQRYFRQHSEATTSVTNGQKKPQNPSVPNPSADSKETAMPLSDAVNVTLQEYRPFKRLKSHLSLLTRAEQGHREPMQKLLDWTYARRGVLRWQALTPFLKPIRPATRSEPAPPSPALLSLISDPIALGTDEGSNKAQLPGDFTFPLPRPHKTGGHPFLRLQNKARNAQAKSIKKKLDRLSLPLGIPVIRHLESIAQQDETGRGVADPLTKEDRELSKSEEKIGERLLRGDLHPSATNFRRQKRRTYGWLLGEVPVLSPPPPLPNGATNLVLEQLASHYERRQQPMDRRGRDDQATTPLWVSKPRLPTDDIVLLVKAWNEHLTLASAPGNTAQDQRVETPDDTAEDGAKVEEKKRSKRPKTQGSDHSNSPASSHAAPAALSISVSPFALFKPRRGASASRILLPEGQESVGKPKPRSEPGPPPRVANAQAASSASSGVVGAAEAELPTGPSASRSSPSPPPLSSSSSSLRTRLPVGKTMRAHGKSKAAPHSHRFVTQEEADWARRTA